MSFYYYLVFLSLNLVHDLTAFVVRIFVIVADFSLASAFGIAFSLFFQSLIDTFSALRGRNFRLILFLFSFWTFDFPVWRQFSDFLSKFFIIFFLPARALLCFILFIFFFNSIVWLSFLSTPPDTSFMSTTVSFLFLTSGIVFADNPSFVILLLLIFSA